MLHHGSYLQWKGQKKHLALQGHLHSSREESVINTDVAYQVIKDLLSFDMVEGWGCFLMPKRGLVSSTHHPELQNTLFNPIHTFRLLPIAVS